jgi:hypothetical protein
MALAPNDLMPQFAVTTLEGNRFDYSCIWQRRNLVLMIIAPTPASAASGYVEAVTARREELDAFDATVVTTADAVASVTAPAVIIADRWGEIYLASTGAQLSELPSASEIFETLRAIAYECPECQGEAR